ncbi:hypothetical protein [Sorangium sp. So ce1097]|uniref:hypothetical protein n=1 Tax=Sorangium sp. So ce1097 TaxID=3133330 RepID=UPI003F5F403C
MTERHRVVLGMGCAAAVAFTAGQASALHVPPSVLAPQVSTSPLASAGGPGGAAPAPAGGAGGAAPGDAASRPLPPPPPAGAWSVAPPGYPPPPPGWVWRPVPTAPPASAQRAPKPVWYGWQHLLVLGGSLVLVPVAVSLETQELLLMSFKGLVLGGPIIHWAHGNVGKGFASLGLNIGGTLVGGLIGVASAGEAHEDAWVTPAVVGLLVGGSVGLIAANIVDMAVLPYEEEPRKLERHEHVRLRLAPQVGLAPRGATFGLGGSF